MTNNRISFLYHICTIGFVILIGCQSSNDVARPNINQDARGSIDLIPLPVELLLDDGIIPITSEFGYSFEGTQTPRLDRILDRFMDRLEQKTAINFEGENTAITILCEESSTPVPYLGIDETYELTINGEGILLNAKKYVGVERGLQTVLGLIRFEQGRWTLPHVRVRDYPRFSWRGLMIDVSRHWMPKSIILRNLDAMAAVKLNVLHLHLSDDQGFRVESLAFPRLHELGSDGHYYSQEDIREIVMYAADRGIRIVPEFDLPGHVSSWLTGYPDLASGPGPYQVEQGFGIFPGVLDPVKPSTYEFLAVFFKEMAGLFPDEYIHIGGDEVLPDHWQQNEDIQQFMTDNGIPTLNDLHAYFTINCEVILDRLGKKMIGWDEISHDELAKPGNLLQAWRGHDKLFDAVGRGFSGLSSSGWYLDHKTTLAQLYQTDPVEFPGAIAIEPDSNRWSAYRVESRLRGQKTEGLVYLFGPPHQLRGLIYALDQVSLFENATLQNDELSFRIESFIGNLQVRATTTGDTIYGRVNSLIGRYQFEGNKIGGNDMVDGIPFPAYRKVEPLSPEGKDRILGGEACVWTEWLDSTNVESRIWPRTIAVAEKLWSPLEHTQDIEDIYRRGSIFVNNLNEYGISPYSAQNQVVKQLVPTEKQGSFKDFLSILEEVKYYERYAFFPLHSTLDTLNQVVDVVMPESWVSREFTQIVSSFIDDPSDQDMKESVLSQLDLWIPIYADLKEEFQGHPKLKPIEFLGLVLSDLSKIARLKMTGGSLTNEEHSYYLRIKEEAIKGRHGVVLAPAPALIELIDRYLIEI